MKLSHFFIALLALVSACTNKPKPISKNVTKTTVTVAGKKDSVSNNVQKNYGNATISAVCTKTLIQNIQATEDYKKLTTSVTAVKYAVNWVKAANPQQITNGRKITNGIQVVVNSDAKKLGAYIYNNEDGKLYFVNNNNEYIQLNVDSNALKQIRNGCYWGVASHK